MPRTFSRRLLGAVYAWISLGLGLGASAETPEGLPRAPGEVVYGRACASCHANPSGPRVPDLKTLMTLTPEAIYTQMTSGVMVVPAQKLTEDEKRAVAEYLGGRPLDLNRSGSAQTMPNRCASNSALGNPAASAAWNGWSAEGGNTRFAGPGIAGLTPEQTRHLKLKWAFGFPGGGGTAYGQPTVVAGRIFVGSDNGYVYSLDAASGCVYWSFQARAGVRTAPVIGRRPMESRDPTSPAASTWTSA